MTNTEAEELVNRCDLFNRRPCNYCRDGFVENGVHGRRCVKCMSRKGRRAYARTKPKVLARTREYSRQNKAEIRKRAAAYKQKAIQKQPLWQSYWQAKSRAAREGVSFTIRYSDLPPPPAYCPVLGIPLRYNSGKRTDYSPSLDKIIPGKGYVPGNVAIISFRANRLKGDASLCEIEAIARYLRLQTGAWSQAELFG